MFCGRCGNKLNDGDTTFYPYDRSPKRYSK